MKRTEIHWITQKQDITDEYSTNFILKMGICKKIESGIYNFSPFGNMLLQSLKRKISEKMNDIGYYEVLNFPLSSKRFWNKRKDILQDAFVLQNKVIHPTSEEIVLKEETNKIFSFSINFRNEIRPSFGLCRTYVFLMKDAYCSFKTINEMEDEYKLVIDFYKNLFWSLGIYIQLNQKEDNCEFFAFTDSDIKTDVFQERNIVELGHVFKFSSVFSFPSISFGIGVTRLFQYIVLKNKLSIILPFKYAIIQNVKKKELVDNFYNNLINIYGKNNILYDDSEKSIGEKLYDLRSVGFQNNQIIVL